jgi:hypothetical protein
VATAGDVNGDGYADVIVGAPGNGIGGEGSAYVYHGSPAGPQSTADAFYYGQQQDQQLGYSVSDAGDVNGDGYADILIGTPHYDGGGTDAGYAGIVMGSEDGLTNPAVWFVVGNAAGDMLGYDVAGIGDVNGDGYDDAAVSAPYTDDGFSSPDAGAVHVYHGSSGGLSATPNWTELGSDANELFGYSIDTAGDVNGDGLSDLIVGAVNYDDGQTGEGGAFVFEGTPSGLTSSSAWVGESNQTSARFGASVSTAGDVNGDGYSDVIVGADDYDGVAARSGGAWVYLGSGAGVRPYPAWSASGEQSAHKYGHSVATAGDVNGDGFADVAVGALQYSGTENEEGKVYVYHGHTLGVAPTAAWTFESNQAQAHLGVSVATAGDVNGDGYADVIMGADGYDDSHTDEGRSWVFLGSSSGLSPTPAWTYDCEQDGCGFGRDVTSAGDVNGDGYADVTVGAPTWDDWMAVADRGGVWTFLGNSKGRALRPTQLRGASLVPIARLGASDAEDGFRLLVLVRTPFGRAFAKLEWEVEPLGSPFDGAGTETSAIWFDTGPFGVPRIEGATDLDEGDPYHWRVRILYHPRTSPFQQRSRWFTVPWSGWRETDLRMACTAGVPVSVPSLSLSKVSVTRLSWTSPGPWLEHDLVRGDLSTLHANLGNFTLSVTDCLANDTTQSFHDDPEVPLEGEGYWYLVRDVSCAGAGPYDSGGPGQIWTREAKLNHANLSCP